jgi:hypothetical protein
VYKTSLCREIKKQIPEDPTYTADVDDQEPLVGQNMLVAGHQGHSMPVKVCCYWLNCCVPIFGKQAVREPKNTQPAWLTNQDTDRELVDPAK